MNLFDFPTEPGETALTAISYKPKNYRVETESPKGDTFVQAVFKQGFKPVEPVRFTAPAKAPSWDDPYAQIIADYNKRLDKQFADILITAFGRVPAAVELQGRAKKMTFPDGSCEYAYDNHVFLRLNPDGTVAEVSPLPPELLNT